MDTENLGVYMARVWRTACFPRTSGPGNHLLAGIITLLLSIAAFWASGKLLDRADKAKQAAHENLE